jgi:hypothetical protein
MEQRVPIKYLREDCHRSAQIYFQLVEDNGDKAASCPDVSYCDMFAWCDKALKVRLAAQDRQTSNYRIEGALEASPNVCVGEIAEPEEIAPSTVFFALTEVLYLEFHNGRWLSHKLNDSQTQARVQLAFLFHVEFEKARRRNCA